AAADHYVVSTRTSATAGTAQDVTVTAKDKYNNVATGYTGTVHFTSSDNAATLAGDYAFTTSDAGVHVFAGGVTFKTAGNQTVTATDAGSHSITGKQSGISVSPAAASYLG